MPTSDTWELRREEWRRRRVQQAASLADRLLAHVRGLVAVQLAWPELCAVAATSRLGLGAAREAVRRIRADVTRGSSRLGVRVVGRPEVGAPFPAGFTYAPRLRWGQQPLGLSTGDVHAKVAVAWRHGWCLVAEEAIAKGARVCDYTGDVVSARAARQRERFREPTYVLSLLEHSMDESVPAWRTTVDATDHGGVGRFVNHSCDPNLTLVPARNRRRDVVPVLAFFARRDVASCEELTLDYAGLADHLGPHPPATCLLENSETKCVCGAAACRRWLPRHVDRHDNWEEPAG